MLTKIKRQDCLTNYPKFPIRTYSKDEEQFYYPKVLASYILTLPSKSFKGHAKILGTELAKLAKKMSFDYLIFLGDTEISWLYQNNDYKPAKEAYQFLVDNKVGKRFNGALQVDNNSLPTFTKHLSWLTRCNASLPYFHFTDKAQNFIGSICKYGNLHFNPLNEKTDNIFNEVIGKSNFDYLQDSNCYNQFGKTSAIKGRRIVI